MPNGHHPQEPPHPRAQREARVGVCPRCGSARIRTRRRRHWRLIWRCRGCRRTFAKPRRVGLSRARDLGSSPVYENRIRRLESRARRKLGGRHGLTLGCLIWLVILMACAGIMVFWLLSNEKISSVLPPSVTGSVPQLPSTPQQAATTPGFPPTANNAVRQLLPAAEPATPELVPPPSQRHLKEKLHMLELINERRVQAGAPPVELGNNNAAQLHAESSLQNCVSSHWEIDGLKPYMPYSLAGGYQSNGENGSGSDYCIRWSDGYCSLDPIEIEIRQAMEQWMDSPGHRRNILDRWHRRVNIGLAWDRYNFKAFQHFEGDYVEFDTLPTLTEGVLTLAGRTRNGARFDDAGDLMVQVFYDPPPHPLTRGQVSRTYCYDSGLPVAGLREPLTVGWFYDEHEYPKTYTPCPDPYDMSPEARAPESPEDADRFWQSAYSASRNRVERTSVPWITASEWTASGESFSVTANLRMVINQHGNGVYTVLLWDRMDGEDVVISEYSIFHGVTQPDTYTEDTG